MRAAFSYLSLLRYSSVGPSSRCSWPALAPRICLGSKAVLDMLMVRVHGVRVPKVHGFALADSNFA